MTTPEPLSGLGIMILSLLFCDLIESEHFCKSNEGFLTSVFRKPTFAGQNFCWDSFGPTKRKTNLIETPVHRALMICSKSKHQLDSTESWILRKHYSKSSCPRKLHFLTVNQKKDRKSVQFT